MKTIKSARRVAWASTDDRWIDGATVAGRVLIELDGGGVVHALLLHRDGASLAVFLDRELGGFVTCGLESDGHGARRS